jgi:hypothetical protein
MASTANPFASLIDKSLAPDMGASGVANPFLQPVVSGALASGALASDTSSDGSWTDEPSFSHLFKPLPTRSRAATVRSSIIKRSLPQTRINNPSSQVGMQCMRGEDGKYYYIPIDPYNPEHLKIIDKLSPLLVNPPPPEFQKGALYTFIFASVITKNPDTGADIELVPPKLYACRAQNIFEFGTKHHHIFFRMALTNELASVARDNGINENKVEYGLYASGEIKCVAPTKLMVNFFSGTYKMKRKIKIPKLPKYRKGIPYEIDDMIKLMHTIDPNYKIKYNPAPFITSESVPITQKHLDFLESKGIPAFGFNNQRQCYEMKIHIMRAKNMENRTLGLEEMKQKYQQIMNPPPAPPPTNANLMTSAELKEYADNNKLTVPEPPYDGETKKAVRQIVQAHMDTNKGANKGANKGKGGGKMTLKKKQTLKKRTRKNKH